MSLELWIYVVGYFVTLIIMGVAISFNDEFRKDFEHRVSLSDVFMYGFIAVTMAFLWPAILPAGIFYAAAFFGRPLLTKAIEKATPEKRGSK